MKLPQDLSNNHITFSEGLVPIHSGVNKAATRFVQQSHSLRGPRSHPFWCKQSCFKIRPTITYHYGFIHLPSNGGAVLKCQPDDSCFRSWDHQFFQKSSHKSSPIGESHLLWNQYLRLMSKWLVAQLGEDPRCFSVRSYFPCWDFCHKLKLRDMMLLFGEVVLLCSLFDSCMDFIHVGNGQTCLGTLPNSSTVLILIRH